MKPLTAITNSTELKHRIMQLNSLKEEQENTLKGGLKEVYYSLQFSTLIKRTLRNLKEDTEIKQGAVEASLTFGTNYLLDKLMMRKGTGFKSYLLNMGLKKLFSHFISNNHHGTGILHKFN